MGVWDIWGIDILNSFLFCLIYFEHFFFLLYFADLNLSSYAYGCSFFIGC
jgi:hypothetical protein